MLDIYKLFLLLLYFEHLFIFWTYSYIWNIFNKNTYTKKDGYIVAKYSLSIQLYILPLLGIPFYIFYKDIDNITNTPTFSLYEFVQICMLLLWEDSIFYIIHRLLHTRKLYTFHKLHHSWKQPIPWGALYSSIPENILLNFFPVISGPIVVGLNMYYTFLWVGLATLTSLIAHSRFGGSHDIHHQQFNVNYGNTKFIDKIFGTYNE